MAPQRVSSTDFFLKRGSDGGEWCESTRRARNTKLPAQVEDRAGSSQRGLPSSRLARYTSPLYPCVAAHDPVADRYAMSLGTFFALGVPRKWSNNHGSAGRDLLDSSQLRPCQFSR